VLIFTRTKHRADSVARRLQREGERVAVLHSNKSQNQRDLALARFKGGQARVLVATDVASRGLDIEGIGLVVNYDTPRDPDDYVHRVGRTARAKRPGKAVTLVTIDEFKYVKKIEGLIKQRITRRSEGLPKVERDPNMPPPDRPRSERPGRGERGVRPASAGPGQVHGSRGSRGGHAPDDAPPKLTRSQRKARNEQQRAQAGAPGAPPPAEPPSNPRHGSSGGTTRGSQGPRRGGSGGSGGAGRSGGPGSGGRVRASGGRDYGYTD
jgi:ATP-dependent RNA helicase RhlE